MLHIKTLNRMPFAEKVILCTINSLELFEYTVLARIHHTAQRASCAVENQ